MVFGVMHSKRYEMVAFHSISTHIKASEWEMKHLKKCRMLDSVIPVHFFFLSFLHTTLYILSQVVKVLSSLEILWFYDSPKLQTFFSKNTYHFSNSYPTISLMNAFEISFIFVRQDKIETSLRQQIIACTLYVFSPH